MAVNIQGDNSAASPGVVGGDTDTGVRMGTNELSLVTGGTNRVNVDSSGNVGIGTTSPGSLFELNAAAGTTAGISFGSVGDSITASRYIGICNATDQTDISTNSGFSGIELGGPSSTNEGYLAFHTHDIGVASGERMRIDKAGTVLIGKTSDTLSTAGWVINSGSFKGRGQLTCGSSGAPILRLNHTGGGGTEYVVESWKNGTQVGSISVTASATAYNTSSDYRLKENVIPLTGAADRVNQLQVHRFNFIADPDKTVDGFIAHEVQTIVPECVTGTKDEVDADGNPIYQGIDQSKLVPLLTAALQEAIVKIEILETKVAALEGGK